MAPASFLVCYDVNYVVDSETFVFFHSGRTSCTITFAGTNPLTKNSYTVPAGGTKVATVKQDAIAGEYPYKCTCAGKKNRGDPRIIVGS